MMNCKFCGAGGFKQLKQHERQCKMNPDRTTASGHVGKNHYCYGATCSEETRHKISLSSSGRTHSRESREKISQSMQKYLSEHPDRVPYLMNHSSERSYPEKYFSVCFEGTNIRTEHRIGLYSLDFANVEKQIYFEVDGEQHYLDKKIVESDKRRQKFLENLGWKMYRCRWSEFQKLSPIEKTLFVNDIKNKMGS